MTLWKKQACTDTDEKYSSSAPNWTVLEIICMNKFSDPEFYSRPSMDLILSLFQAMA
jgi:hypothetical protein